MSSKKKNKQELEDIERDVAISVVAKNIARIGEILSEQDKNKESQNTIVN
jgi:hypothetical protein